MLLITPDDAAIEVFGGVDTHQDTHTAAMIYLVGRVLGTQEFPATAASRFLRRSICHSRQPPE